MLDMNKEELKEKEGMKTITREKADEILSEKKEEIIENWNLCECRNAEQNSELEWETQNFAGITTHTLQCNICKKSKLQYEHYFRTMDNEGNQYFYVDFGTDEKPEQYHVI